MSEFVRKVLIDKGRTLITHDHPAAKIIKRIIDRFVQIQPRKISNQKSVDIYQKNN